jgi:DNA invertase Pin-like site-specific DNA recombinase
MPRISKKIVKNAEIIKETPVSEKIYKTAIYARISSEDSSADSGTIENQILLAKKYIENKPYLELCEIFIDNGQTGTNFNREGFQNLMEAVKRGTIDCIIVKDLSRFGRDYIETGNYLEKIFPFLRVRFIAINDDYDSHDPAKKNVYDLTVILKNFMNDTYAKDISKKSRSALKIKQQKGEYIGAKAPYGYMKSPENKHKLVIDEETAPVVRDIFKWKFDGMSDTEIVRKLENLKIPSPRNYLYSKGLLYSEKYSKKILWNKKSIRNILEYPVYIGHMAQGKIKSRFELGLSPEYLPRDEWIIVENTHEPIIEAEIFYAVRDILEKRIETHRKLCNNKSKDRENIFIGFVRCGECGKKLVRSDKKSNGKPYFYFRCPNYINHLSNGCVKKRISEYNLKKAVHTVIQKQISLFFT